jgi:hypothetical protein
MNTHCTAEERQFFGIFTLSLWRKGALLSFRPKGEIFLLGQNVVLIIGKISRCARNDKNLNILCRTGAGSESI